MGMGDKAVLRADDVKCVSCTLLSLFYSFDFLCDSFFFSKIHIKHNHREFFKKKNQTHS